MMKAPLFWSAVTEHLRLVAQGVNQLADGKSNAYGTVTLTANAASTTVTDPKAGPSSIVTLEPRTANAAAAVATTYVTTHGDGTFVLTHANNAQNDKTFGYSLQGG